jgi:flagellar biosynthesis protein FlhF
MKITRHTAPDMRQALRAVRERLGPDAVILSTRRIPLGVEITAAMDFDAERLAAESAQVRAVDLAAEAPRIDSPMFDRTPNPAPAPLYAAAAQPVAAAVAATVDPAAQAESILAATANADAMGSELKTLRRMLETQLAQLAWKDLTRRAPLHADILRELTEIGLEQSLAAEVVGQLPPQVELTQARRMCISSLAQRVLVTGDRWLESGGHIALVGPTGVGKTTTLAKLAVRWVLRHGARDLALVAADTQRVGAQDQVRSLGQLLGVPVYTPESLAELPAVLARLDRFRCVLIDTAGASQRDAQLAERLAALAGASETLQTTLVLAASTQAGAVAESVRRFAAARPTSCILTKVDEAASLGGMLSILMRARLPIAYVSEGQRVPEDLRPARSLELVSSAVQLAQMTGAVADEDLLKRRFGEVAHALA